MEQREKDHLYDHELIDRAKKYAIRCHTETNHLYDGKPYHEAHLQKVVDEVIYWLDFFNITHTPTRAIIIAATWCHDIIEDARQTYNDVKEKLGIEVAEMVFALTNLRGRYRDDRASDEYYKGIRECLEGNSNLNFGATLIKLCDRIANIQAGLDGSKSSMVKTHRLEHWKFVGRLLVSKERSKRFQPLALKMTKQLFSE